MPSALASNASAVEVPEITQRTAIGLSPRPARSCMLARSLRPNVETTPGAWITRILLVAGVVASLAGLADVAINWENLQRAKQSTGKTSSVSSPPSGEATTSSSAPEPRPSRAVPATGNDGGDKSPSDPSASPRPDPPVFPLDYTLRDGEQRTILGDQASVAAEFNQVGSEGFVTLRVGTTEGESVFYHSLYCVGFTRLCRLYSATTCAGARPTGPNHSRRARAATRAPE
jgi:hypothetical protein